MPSSSEVFVYLLRCADGTYYVGHTDNLAERVKRHNEGVAASYTARRRPVTVVYFESHGTAEAAIKRERQLKCWSSKKKAALVAGDFAQLKRLSRRHQPKKRNSP
jgi:predicted GIY-YIG superfamily endonuclease